jgi:hypothetical protein
VSLASRARLELTSLHPAMYRSALSKLMMPAVSHSGAAARVLESRSGTEQPVSRSVLEAEVCSVETPCFGSLQVSTGQSKESMRAHVDGAPSLSLNLRRCKAATFTVQLEQ